MKSKIIDILQSKYFLLCVFLYAFVAYTFNMAFSIFNPNLFPYFVATFSVIYCIVGCLCLIFLEDTKNILIMTFFFPFFHATLSNVDFNTLLALSPAVIMVIGLVVHHIKFKTQLKMKPLIPGAIVFWLGVCLGGFGATPTEPCQADYQWYYTVIYIVVSVLIIYVMLVLANDSKMTFMDFTKLLTFVGILIIYEMFFYGLPIYLEKGIDTFNEKVLQLGWGNSNTIAIILLMIIPCIFYLLVNYDQRKYRIACGVLINIVIISLVMTISRVGCLVGAFEILICAGYSLYSSKFKKETLTIFGISFLFLLIIAFVFFMVNRELFHKILEVSTRADFVNLNGRKDVYEKFFEVYSQNKVFGVGLVSSFRFKAVPDADYSFCHSSLFQLMLVSGGFGLCALLFHWILIYGNLVMHLNKEKFILMLCYLSPGLYGLVDVTYLVPVYMIVLLSSYCMINEIFEREEPLNQLDYQTESSK